MRRDEGARWRQANRKDVGSMLSVLEMSSGMAISPSAAPTTNVLATLCVDQW